MTRTPGKRKRRKAREWWIMVGDEPLRLPFGQFWDDRRSAVLAACDFYPTKNVRSHVIKVREVVKK